MIIDITGIVIGVLGVLFAAFTTWFTTKALPWLKARTSKAQWDLWKTVVTTAVRAAEEIYRYEGQGEAKFAYVEDTLRKAGIILDTEKVTQLIKSAVNDLRLEKAYTAPPVTQLPPGEVDKDALMDTSASPLADLKG